MKRIRALLLLTGVAVTSAGSSAHAGTATLILDSAPGSYIGGGNDYDITNDNVHPFSVYPSYNLPDGQLTNIEFDFYQSPTVFASVTFSTHELGIPLQVGVYSDASRFPFESAGQAGLDVTFYDEGSNVSTDSFTITNATFYIDGSGNYQVSTFAATFDQVSDNDTSHVTGSVVYNAEVTPVPEPSSLVLTVIGFAGLIAGCRSQSRRTGNSR